VGREVTGVASFSLARIPFFWSVSFPLTQGMQLHNICQDRVRDVAGRTHRFSCSTHLAPPYTVPLPSVRKVRGDRHQVGT